VPKGLAQKATGVVAVISSLVQKVFPLKRQRQNAQKLSWEASFPE